MVVQLPLPLVNSAISVAGCTSRLLGIRNRQFNRGGKEPWDVGRQEEPAPPLRSVDDRDLTKTDELLTTVFTRPTLWAPARDIHFALGARPIL